jgi:hypothetical protein
MLVRDIEAFVASLTNAQTAFLHAELQGVRGQRVVPLREALLERITNTENPGGLRTAMFSEFYRPETPIVAVPINGRPYPIRKRR